MCETSTRHGTPPTSATPGWSRAAAAIVLGGAVWLCLVAVQHLGADFVRPHPLELLVGLALIVSALRVERWPNLAPVLRHRGFLWSCVLVFLVSRLAVVFLLPTQPVSDFAAYDSLARRMATGGPLPTPEEDLLFFSWGYPLALAPWYALFGESPLLAKLLNVAAGVLALLLVYPLARAAGGPTVAGGTAALYALWPAQLFLTPVLASEHLALVFCLLYLLALVRVLRDGSVLMALFGGGCLGLACAIRPALGVVLVVGLVLIALRMRGVRTRVLSGVFLVLGVVAVQAGYRGLLAAVYHRTPPTVAWWNLLAGMNYEARGRWNQPDADRFFAHPMLAESNRFARAEIWRRLTDKPRRLPDLVRRKLRLLWGDNYYGVWWATCSLAPTPTGRWFEQHAASLFTWSQLIHLTMLALCVRGAYRLLRRPHNTAATLLLLLILSGTALHAVFETQTRYSHVFALGALFVAAVGMAGVPRRRVGGPITPACPGSAERDRAPIQKDPPSAGEADAARREIGTSNGYCRMSTTGGGLTRGRRVPGNRDPSRRRQPETNSEKRRMLRR